MYKSLLNRLMKWVLENIYGIFLIFAVAIIADAISNLNDRMSSPVISLVAGVYWRILGSLVRGQNLLWA